jgi:hypothetical protein
MGWLEVARRDSMAERFAEAAPGSAAPAGSAAQARGKGSIDEDEDQLAAYNEYLARINRGPGAKQ